MQEARHPRLTLLALPPLLPRPPAAWFRSQAAQGQPLTSPVTGQVLEDASVLPNKLALALLESLRAAGLVDP